MNRRKFIAGISVPLTAVTAACLVSGDNAGGSKESSQNYTISIESVEPIPDKYNLTGTVTTESESFKGKAPPRVRITITNKGRKEIRLETGNRPVMGELSSTMSQGLWLLAPERLDGDSVDQSDDGCWFISPPVYRTEAAAKTHLAQNESETVSADIFADGDHFDNQCPDPGSYQFTKKYWIEQREGSNDKWKKVGEFDWGFTVRVTDEES